MIDQPFLLDRFYVNQAGFLCYRHRVGKRIRKDDVAGSVLKTGVRVIRIGGKQYRETAIRRVMAQGGDLELKSRKKAAEPLEIPAWLRPDYFEPNIEPEDK